MLNISVCAVRVMSLARLAVVDRASLLFVSACVSMCAFDIVVSSASSSDAIPSRATRKLWP